MNIEELLSEKLFLERCIKNTMGDPINVIHLQGQIMTIEDKIKESERKENKGLAIESGKKGN
jgi:hypothetical protein